MTNVPRTQPYGDVKMSKTAITTICVAFALVALMGLACGQQLPPEREFSPEPAARAEPAAQADNAAPCPDGTDTCGVRDVSDITLLDLKIKGAMFDYETPSTEDVLKLGLFGAGASPTHLAALGSPVANSLRCDWHASVMTNDQR